jgi:hypothetical protein
MNLAHVFCKVKGMTVDEARDRYEGCCIDFAGDLADWIGPEARMAYFDNLEIGKWRYHCAVQVGDEIHCLWNRDPVKLRDYLQMLGAATVEYPAEEHEFAV